MSHSLSRLRAWVDVSTRGGPFLYVVSFLPSEEERSPRFRVQVFVPAQVVRGRASRTSRAGTGAGGCDIHLKNPGTKSGRVVRSLLPCHDNRRGVMSTPLPAGLTFHTGFSTSYRLDPDSQAGRASTPYFSSPVRSSTLLIINKPRCSKCLGQVGVTK